MRSIKKMFMILAMVLAMTTLFAITAFAATEYPITTCTDNPATTDINEQKVCEAIVAIYGKQPNVMFSTEKTDLCNVKLSIKVDNKDTIVWVSDVLSPKTTTSETDTSMSNSEIIDCLIELEKDIDTLVFVIIVVIIMTAGAVGLNIWTRYKLNRLKDDFDAYVASKVRTSATTKKPHHKKKR